MSRHTWPIIVGGCFRSGTSLMRRLLNAHSRIHCGPEVKFFRDFYNHYNDDRYGPFRFSATARTLLPEAELLEVLGRAFVTLHERAAARAGKARWADKTPENVTYLTEWERLLGEEWRLLHVVRNPLDTLASIKEARFPLVIPAALEERIALYRRYVECGLRFGDEHPDRYYVVVYEQLVLDPRATLAAVMRWLGEELEEDQLAFGRVHHERGLEDPKVDGTTAIHAESVGRWPEILMPNEARTIWNATTDLWKRLDPLGEYTPRITEEGTCPDASTDSTWQRTPRDVSFVPVNARRRWPFVLGGPDAARRPAWNARLLLSWGTLEALLGIQPRAHREPWRNRPRAVLATFLHAPGVGVDHPSRMLAAKLVRPRETVLDIGCGAGVNYEILAAAGLASGYVGVDSSEPSIEIARELYPNGDFRVGNAHTLVPQFGARSFNVVHMRHVLEHLPDFEEAMTEALAVARRLAIFIFFLTPRNLPCGVRKINLRLNPEIYTYVYSRGAIEAFLARRGLEWRWTLGVGISRAGWFAGEMNSVLEVRYP